MATQWTREEIFDKVTDTLPEVLEITKSEIRLSHHIVHNAGASGTDFVDIYLRLVRTFPELRTQGKMFCQEDQENYTVEFICDYIANIVGVEVAAQVPA